MQRKAIHREDAYKNKWIEGYCDNPDCDKPLLETGIELNPAEEQRTYSSTWNHDLPGHGHARSMLDSYQAWSVGAGGTDFGAHAHWVVLDAGEIVDVAGIVTQPRFCPSAELMASLPEKDSDCTFDEDRFRCKSSSGIFGYCTTLDDSVVHEGWKKCANEGVTEDCKCDFGKKPGYIRYGSHKYALWKAPKKITEKKIIWGPKKIGWFTMKWPVDWEYSQKCSNADMGIDPVPGYPKTCECRYIDDTTCSFDPKKKLERPPPTPCGDQFVMNYDVYVSSDGKDGSWIKTEPLSGGEHFFGASKSGVHSEDKRKALFKKTVKGKVVVV